MDWLSLLFYAVKSSSNVATVGGSNVIGPGQIVGQRAVITLPTRGVPVPHPSRSVSITSTSTRRVKLGSDRFSPRRSRISPLVASLLARPSRTRSSPTQFNAGDHLQSAPRRSSPLDEFDAKRYLGVAELHAPQPGCVAHPRVAGRLPVLRQGAGAAGRRAAGVERAVRASAASIPCAVISNPKCLATTASVGNLELAQPQYRRPAAEAAQGRDRRGPPRFTTFNEWRLFMFADGGYVSDAEAAAGSGTRRSMPGATASARASRCSTTSTAWLRCRCR